MPQLPRVIGHRGAAAHAPENTLAGLRCAKRLGCTWVEFDARLTADGALVLCHDPALDRTTDGRGLVSAHTLAEIRRCDAGNGSGETVPTLDEALLLCAELGLGANIEMKSDPGRQYATGAAVAATLARLQGQLPELLVSSFEPWTLAALRACGDARVPTGHLFRLVPRGWAEMVARVDAVAIGANHRRLRRSQVAAMRAAGYQVAAYTVNDAARARQLYDWGVASVFSDRPDIILQGSAVHFAALSSSTDIAAAPLDPEPARQGAIR